jgi:hypothetical protein
MNQQPETKKGLLLKAARVGIFFWMFSVIIVYLIRFAPPEFWSILDKLGLWYFFKELRVWLQPFFEAGYLE